MHKCLNQGTSICVVPGTFFADYVFQALTAQHP